MSEPGLWAEVREDVGGWLLMAATAIGPALIVIAVRDRALLTGVIGGLITAWVVPIWIRQLREGARVRREQRPPGHDGSSPPKRRRP